MTIERDNVLKKNPRPTGEDHGEWLQRSGGLGGNREGEYPYSRARGYRGRTQPHEAGEGDSAARAPGDKRPASNQIPFNICGIAVLRLQGMARNRKQGRYLLRLAIGRAVGNVVARYAHGFRPERTGQSLDRSRSQQRGASASDP